LRIENEENGFEQLLFLLLDALFFLLPSSFFFALTSPTARAILADIDDNPSSLVSTTAQDRLKPQPRSPHP
jgi:hypothetical protein